MPMAYSSFISGFGEFALAGFPLPLPEHRNEYSMYFPPKIAAMVKRTYYPYLWHDEPRKAKSEVNRVLLRSVEKEL